MNFKFNVFAAGVYNEANVFSMLSVIIYNIDMNLLKHIPDKSLSNNTWNNTIHWWRNALYPIYIYHYIIKDDKEMAAITFVQSQKTPNPVL